MDEPVPVILPSLNLYSAQLLEAQQRCCDMIMQVGRPPPFFFYKATITEIVITLFAQTQI